MYNVLMLLFEFFRWWYSEGIIARIKSVMNAISHTADAFSIGLMIKTLFRPFKRISAAGSGVTQSLDNKMKELGDQLISRFIGFFARTVMILAGTLSLIVLFFGGVLLVIFHLFMPIAPIIGLILTLWGGIPYVAI